MPVKRGRVIERGRAVEVEGERHFMPKGCDPIIGPRLKEFAGKEVEVLMVRDVVLAIRALEPQLMRPPFRPVITCYLCPPDVVFDPQIMAKIEPLITESLLKSGYLDKKVAAQLGQWHEKYG